MTGFHNYVNLMALPSVGPQRPLSLHNGVPLGHYLCMNLEKVIIYLL